MNGTHERNQPADVHVVVVGCGNIGSHVLPHLARMPEVGRVTLIDRDDYEPGNLAGQDIVAADFGKAKADVQARRLRRINPRLHVVPIVDAVENLPLALLRSNVILTGLDSKIARQVVNEKAWQLGSPLIDAGVDGPGLLVRVSVYRPGLDRACLQCHWTDAEYESVEQVYPCTAKVNGRNGVETPPTNAPSSLGALAASLQAIECQKVLNGSADDDGQGREILLDAAYGNLYVTSLERDAGCRMREHGFDPVIASPTCTVATEIGRVLGEPSVAAGVSAGSGDIVGANGGIRLRVVGQPFVRGLTCPDCGERRDFIRLKASLRRYWCWRCHGEMVAAGFDTRDELVVGTLPPEMLGRSLGSIGVRAGDVLAVSSADGDRRIVVGGEYRASAAQKPRWQEEYHTNPGRHE
jgi:molybdopterin/thiamine biosynthesis adenylyltransferase